MEEGKKDAEQRCSDLEERLIELEEIGTRLLKTEIRKLEQKVIQIRWKFKWSRCLFVSLVVSPFVFLVVSQVVSILGVLGKVVRAPFHPAEGLGFETRSFPFVYSSIEQ